MGSPQVQEISLRSVLNGMAVPVFVRKVSRPTAWEEALGNQTPEPVMGYLEHPEAIVSLFLIGTDLELRRVAIALNEGRDSFGERIDLLPILPSELNAAGVPVCQELGDTKCPTAAALHFNAEFTESSRILLLSALLQTKRALGRCSKGVMKRAYNQSLEDRCFAVVQDSSNCKCGAVK